MIEEGRITIYEAKQRLEGDKLCADRIHKLCAELEQAIQEASNRGLYFSFKREGYGIYDGLARPLSAIITRDVRL